jgi:hypothetical protein
MVNVHVYILSDDPASEKIHRLKKLFGHEVFIVNVLSPRCDAKSELDCEYNRCLESLKDSYRNSPSDYTIVIKDTSISLANAETMADIVSTVINSGEFDICYLSKWHDRCDLYTNKTPIEGTNALIAKTQSPLGVQALLFSPSGRDIILRNKPMKNSKFFEMKANTDLGYHLNQETLKNNINSICIVPNLISFDVTEAKSNADYAKSQECESPDNLEQSNIGTSGWIYTILIIIILIIVIWGIWKLKNNYSYEFSM